MKVVCTLLLSLICCLAPVSALTRGMSVHAVEKELGKPESTLAAGSKEILNYPDKGKLTFIQGALYSINDVPLPQSTQATTPSADTVTPPADAVATAPILETELLVMRNDQTITESIQQAEAAANPVQELYNYSSVSKDLQKSIEAYESGSANHTPQTAQPLLVKILVGFIVEVLVMLIVLKIAFQLTGFPALWRQLVSLSLAVSLSGVVVAVLLKAGPLNPVGAGIGFILLLVLIRPMTDVREWATAIQIAITARIVSIILMWLSIAGIMAIASL